MNGDKKRSTCAKGRSHTHESCSRVRAPTSLFAAHSFFFGQARGQQQYVATLSQGEGEQRQSTLSVVLRFLVNEIVCQMKRKASKGNNLNPLNSAATLSWQSFFSPLLLAFPAQRKRKCVAVQDFKIEFRVAFCVILKNRPQNHFKAT